MPNPVRKVSDKDMRSALDKLKALEDFREKVEHLSPQKQKVRVVEGTGNTLVGEIPLDHNTRAGISDGLTVAIRVIQKDIANMRVAFPAPSKKGHPEKGK